MLPKSEEMFYQMVNSTRATYHHIYFWIRMLWHKDKLLKSLKKDGKTMLTTKEHKDKMKLKEDSLVNSETDLRTLNF